MVNATYDRTSEKHPCVINSGALWLLMVAGRAVGGVPGIAPNEHRLLMEAVAAGMRALNDANGRLAWRLKLRDVA